MDSRGNDSVELTTDTSLSGADSFPNQETRNGQKANDSCSHVKFSHAQYVGIEDSKTKLSLRAFTAKFAPSHSQKLFHLLPGFVHRFLCDVHAYHSHSTDCARDFAVVKFNRTIITFTEKKRVGRNDINTQSS